MNNINIILIDDHKMFRNSLKTYLESKGNHTVVYCAENGKEGIEYIEHNKVDLVILDIEMPVLDGVKTLRYLKEKFPGLSILVISFFSSENLQHRILLEGASGVLCKSDDLNELDMAIQTVVMGNIYISNAVGREMLDLRKNLKKTLTSKELIMLDLLIKELKIEDIAKQLKITKRSAENLRIKIKTKVGAKTTYGLAQYAIANGLKYFTSN